MVRAVGRPEVRSQLAALGMEPMTNSPEEFASALAEDVRIWAEVLRAMRNPTE
jgi:tripartite-type tricarboxylate transporter receptor subunit TctC